MRSWRVLSRCSSPLAYSSALWPSIPVAPSFRVRRYASCSHATSMWWASVVSAIVGASLASFAIRSSFVEMCFELDVSFIVPSTGSSLRCRPLLSWLPWVGSPASRLLLRHSDFPLRHLTRFASFGGSASQRRRQDLPSSSATLATHAPLYDSGGTYPSRPPGLRPYVLLSRYCLPSSPTRRLPRLPKFRSPITRPTCSLSTLRVGRYLPLTQDSLPAGGPALAGRGLNPLSCSPGFCLAWLT